MKIKVTSNFSFEKLINFLEKGKGLGDTVDRYITKPIIEDSTAKIRNNEVTPATSEKTLARRRAIKSPPTISNSTLYDTGKLHDSIRLTDKRGWEKTSSVLKNAKLIEMERYGYYHQIGSGTKKREFLELAIKNADTASKEIMKRMVRSWKTKLAK